MNSLLIVYIEQQAISLVGATTSQGLIAAKLNQRASCAPPLRKTSDELFRGLQAADETAIGRGELLQKSR